MKTVSFRLTLPQPEHKALRVLVAQRGTNVRALVRDLVRRELAQEAAKGSDEKKASG